MIGEILNDTYRVERLLGSGNMGVVYVAQHRRLGRRFALKLLRGNLSTRADSRARFRREAQVASQLQHPNIVEVVDYNITDEGLPYLVMELLEGELLRQRIDRLGRLSLAQTSAVLAQIAAALKAAHKRGVVHRDLKPSNIILFGDDEGDEQVKVLDFGIAKVAGVISQITRSNAKIGTPRYMAPEQASGRTRDVDHRADIYAVGAMVYEMLSGEPSVTGETMGELLGNVLNRRPMPLAARCEGLAPEVAAVVERALAKRPEERWATMSELWQAFSRAASPTGQPPSPVAAAGSAVEPTIDLEQHRAVPAPMSSLPATVGPEGPAALPAPAATESLVDDGTADRTVPLAGRWTAQPAAGATPPAAPGRSTSSASSVSEEAPTRDIDLAKVDGGRRRQQQQPSLVRRLAAVETAPEEEDETRTRERRVPSPAAGARQRWRLIGAVIAAAALLAGSFAVVLSIEEADNVDSRVRREPTGVRLRRSVDAAVVGARGPFDASVSSADLEAAVARDAEIIAPERTRRLVVRSYPPGASVSADDRLLGTTPLIDARIASGPVVLRLAKAGHRSWVRRLDAGRARLRFNVRLQRAQGAARGAKKRRRRDDRPAILQVMTLSDDNPLWADVYLDGQRIGQSPLRIETKPGRHLLSVRRNGFESRRRRLRLAPGVQKTVRFDLSRENAAR